MKPCKKAVQSGQNLKSNHIFIHFTGSLFKFRSESNVAHADLGCFRSQNWEHQFNSVNFLDTSLVGGSKHSNEQLANSALRAAPPLARGVTKTDWL